MQQFNFDSYAPAEVANKVTDIGYNKATSDFWKTFSLSILAGGFIALAAEFATLVTFDSTLSIGFTKLITGLAFSLGLILVLIAGAELFTGNTLLVVANVEKKVSFTEVLKNWSIVYIGNFIGSILIVALVYLSKQWELGEYHLAAKAVSIASTKTNLDFTVALVRGILCNTLVCLAVWLCYGSRSVVDKIAAIIFPITAFVASGFEHSIANMYYIPMGILLKSDPHVSVVIKEMGIKTANLDWTSFIYNLIPVTIGNIIGGSLMVGLAYWFAYIKKPASSSNKETKQKFKKHIA